MQEQKQEQKYFEKRGHLFMKKVKRLLALTLVLMMVVALFAMPASAYSYNFSFPNTINDSLRSSSMQTRGTANPSFTPYVATVSTYYYLSPQRYSSTNATNIIAKTNISTSSFTFRSGYGGVGQSYCLSGCPNSGIGSWNAYSVNGSWTM